MAAGNRIEDNALVRPISSALVNRLIHAQLRVEASDWLTWTSSVGLHPRAKGHRQTRPDHLLGKPPKHEEPFSTRRSWHMLSDALLSFGDALPDSMLEVLAHSTRSQTHVTQFRAFTRVVRNQFKIERILTGVGLLERATDFPTDGPILIITDGQCDRMRILRDHAFLMPPRHWLPFSPRGPVFRISPD